MGAYTSKELLCIPGKNKSYAIETEYVTELCTQIQLSCIPCLPGHFAGVCSYKGNIIPVVKLYGDGQDDEEPGSGKQDDENPVRERQDGETDGGRNVENDLLLVISCGKYQMGILITGEPYILPAGAAEMVESPAEMGTPGIWAEKEICRNEKEILFVIDMEKSVEGLIICQ